MRDLTVNLKVALAGARILLVGSGGAARGVIGPLLDEAPELIAIAGRTAARADALARQFGSLGPVQGFGLDSIAPGAFDLVINATSAGLAGEVPAIPARVLTDTTFCYDMSYAKAGTAFMQWARTTAASARRRAGGCWSNRPLNRSNCGAGCAPPLRRYWRP